MSWDPDDLLALALSRPSEALARARELLAATPSATVAAVAHQAAGIVLRDFGDIDLAVTDLRAALQFARRAGDDQRQTDIRASLGVALVMAGRTRNGLTMLDEATAAASNGATTPNGGIRAGRILIRRAHVMWLLGRNLDALRAARRAVTLLSGTGDLVWEARALNHRADAYLALGAIDRAERDYARCEELFAECGQQLEYASVRQERGAAAFARGDLPAALAFLDDAQRLVDELGVLEPALYVNKCAVLLAAGLFRDALAETDEALARIETQRGSQTRRAELLYSAAQSAFAAGDLGIARNRATDALRLFRRQHRPWWAGRTELVVLQCRYSDGERSPALLGAARRLALRMDELDPARSGDAHLLAGRTALARGRMGVAEPQLRAAAGARRKDLHSRAVSWLARATLHQARGRPADMLAACDRGLGLIDVYLRSLGATELRTEATSQGSELAAMALRHAAARRNARQVLAWSERWRAAALAVPPVHPPADGVLTAELAALRHLAHRMEAEPSLRRASGRLDQELRRLETAVRKRVLHTPGTSIQPAERFQVGPLLDQLGGDTLIELTEVDGLLLAVVGGGGRVVLHEVGPAAQADRSLTHALFALRREATVRGRQRLDLDRIGARLERDLLGDCVRLLGGAGLVLVPTGRLHAVPWGLLPSLRERPVSVAPSAATWLRAARARPPSGPASPGGGPESGSIVLVGGPALTAGAEEISQLAARYPEAVVLSDGTATAERVLAAMDGAELVHIAAHGSFRSDSPLFSALALDDGPLTVYDLERLSRAPHRIVMSSCSSAVGAPAGADELLGLVSALIAQGCAGVVASVVPVNDPATVPLMLTLHERLSAGDRPAQALARARTSNRGDPVARATADSFIALGA